MLHKQTLPDGRYLVLTTRRANYTTYIFGKATIYKSKESYDGLTLMDGWQMITNIRLGNDTENLQQNIKSFVKSIQKGV